MSAAVICKKALQWFEPHLVHICGHGSDGSIPFEDSKGNAEWVGTQELQRLVQPYYNTLRLIVLNADHSSGLAEALVRYVDCVVCIKDVVADDTAIRFAVSFYRALSSGRSVKDSFEIAVSLELKETPGEVGYALIGEVVSSHRDCSSFPAPTTGGPLRVAGRVKMVEGRAARNRLTSGNAWNWHM